MHPHARAAAALLTAILASGCSTIENLAGGDGSSSTFPPGDWEKHPLPPPQAIYGGTRANIHRLFDGGGGGFAGGVVAGLAAVTAFVDFPFSLALDTAVLPATIPLTLLRTDEIGPPLPREWRWGTIEGRVLSSPTRRPIVGATITAATAHGPERTRTSPGVRGERAGSYALEAPAGRYRLTFEAPGHTTATAIVDVPAGGLRVLGAQVLEPLAQ